MLLALPSLCLACSGLASVLCFLKQLYVTGRSSGYPQGCPGGWEVHPMAAVLAAGNSGGQSVVRAGEQCSMGSCSRHSRAGGGHVQAELWRL